MAKREVARNGEQLLIRFEYDRRLVELVRGLPERRWHPGEKLWTVPVQHVVTVVELLEGEGFSFDQATLELYEERKRELGGDLTVSQLNQKVLSVLKGAFPLPIWLVGEISDFNKSSHRNVVTFKLSERGEDGNAIASVDAVLFPEARQAIENKLAKEGWPFRLEDEVTVRVLVEVDLYVPWGSYRVVVKDLDVAYTLGEVARRREEIIRKLTREGLIELNRSLPFPPLPLRVGLITSLGSDAEKDVLDTLRKSGYAFQVTVHGARMQGPYTEPSVLNALDWFRAHASEFDVVLICRGGGSRTDLAWFDSEALGRAVATFPLPVVVGIGHEQDWSVLDAVGWRVKTPTAAAQLLVQRVKEAETGLTEALGRILTGARERIAEAIRTALEQERRLTRAMAGRLATARADLARLATSLPRAVAMTLGAHRRHLVDIPTRIGNACGRDLTRAREELNRLTVFIPARALAQLSREGDRLAAREKQLRALDPKRVLERGYAILRLEGGSVVREPGQAPPGTPLWAELGRGILKLVSRGGEPSGDE